MRKAAVWAALMLGAAVLSGAGVAGNNAPARALAPGPIRAGNPLWECEPPCARDDRS